MTTTRAALHILTLRWHDLTDALSTTRHTTWPPAMGIEAVLNTPDDENSNPLHPQQLITTTDHHGRTHYQCAHCTHIGPGNTHPGAEDRNPAQLGRRPIPLRLDVYETQRLIEQHMRYAADVIASRIQRTPIPATPAGSEHWTATDRARRRQLAADDAADPRRWPIGTTTRTFQQTVDWLTDRVTGEPGPFEPLTTRDHDTLRADVRAALWLAERALDCATQHTELALPHPGCGGTVTIRGTGDTLPVARCARCRASWTVPALAVA